MLKYLGDALFVGVNGDGLHAAAQRRGSTACALLWRESAGETLGGAGAGQRAVIIFDRMTDTADDLLQALQAGDLRQRRRLRRMASRLPERATVEAYGGRVELIELLSGHSTSEADQQNPQIAKVARAKSPKPGRVGASYQVAR